MKSNRNLEAALFQSRHSESQNPSTVGLAGPSGVPQPSPLPKQGHPEQAAQDHIHGGFEYLQRRRLHNLPGQPGPVLLFSLEKRRLRGDLRNAPSEKGASSLISFEAGTWRSQVTSGLLASPLCRDLTVSSQTLSNPQELLGEQGFVSRLEIFFPGLTTSSLSCPSHGGCMVLKHLGILQDGIL